MQTLSTGHRQTTSASRRARQPGSSLMSPSSTCRKTLKIATVMLLFLCANLSVGLGLVPASEQRSRAEIRAFQRVNPCPSTGKPRGACPGYQVDHVTPLCAYGADTVENMQWLTIEEHRYKTRTDVRVCRQLRKTTMNIERIEIQCVAHGSRHRYTWATPAPSMQRPWSAIGRSVQAAAP